MNDTNIETSIQQLEKHLDRRLDTLESALSILATESKENSKLLVEHTIKIAQGKSELDSFAQSTRDKENTCSTNNNCQHENLFKRVTMLEEHSAELKGGLKIINIIIIPTFLMVVASLIKSFFL